MKTLKQYQNVAKSLTDRAHARRKGIDNVPVCSPVNFSGTDVVLVHANTARVDTANAFSFWIIQLRRGGEAAHREFPGIAGGWGRCCDRLSQ